MSFRVQLINMGTRAAACEYKNPNEKKCLPFRKKSFGLEVEKICTKFKNGVGGRKKNTIWHTKFSLCNSIRRQSHNLFKSLFECA